MAWEYGISQDNDDEDKSVENAQNYTDGYIRTDNVYKFDDINLYLIRLDNTDFKSQSDDRIYKLYGCDLYDDQGNIVKHFTQAF